MSDTPKESAQRYSIHNPSGCGAEMVENENGRWRRNADYERLEAKLVKLQEALALYGRHKSHCHIYDDKSDGVCGCGFDASLLEA